MRGGLAWCVILGGDLLGLIFGVWFVVLSVTGGPEGAGRGMFRADGGLGQAVGFMMLWQAGQANGEVVA